MFCYTIQSFFFFLKIGNEAGEGSGAQILGGAAAGAAGVIEHGENEACGGTFSLSTTT